MNTGQKQFSDWLKTEQGRSLVKAETALLKPILENVYGSAALLLGDPAQEELTKALHIKDYVFTNDVLPAEPTNHFIQAKNTALPIAPDSMHAVLLPHVLEFSDDPHQVLREVEIVLRPQGYVVIIGFNPVSLWSLRKFFSSQGPFAGQFRSMKRINDWLSLLNFEIVKQRYAHTLPFLSKKATALDDLLEKYCPYFGGIYVILAKKNIFGLTPAQPSWKKKAKVVKKPVIKPTTREGV